MQAGSPAEEEAAGICAHCGNDGSDYTERDSQLLYTTCGHALCIKCSNRLFRNKRSILCPKCSTPFAQSTLSRKSLEQQQFEAELKVRKELSQIFTKKREDFGTIDEYNAYLEMVETYIATLASNSEDKDATRAAIAEYQSTHAQDITLAAQAQEAASAKWAAQQDAEAAARMARAAAATAADEADRAAAEAAAVELMDSMLDVGAPAAGGGARGASSGGAVQGKPLVAHVPVATVPEPQLLAPATSRTQAALGYWKRVKGGPPPAALARDREALLRTVNAPRNAAAGFSLRHSTEQLRRQALAGL